MEMRHPLNTAEQQQQAQINPATADYYYYLHLIPSRRNFALLFFLSRNTQS